jgi:hypothetical protein
MSVAIATHCTGLIGCAEAIRPILEVLALVATVIGGGWAVWTYHRSAKLERAKWVKELYEKSYERGDLKTVRDSLDSGDPAKVSGLVDGEPASFTDYLNFFEFLAYLCESNQIEKEEMVGLFDYYLRSLKGNVRVAAYINDPSKGFEKLARVLRRY